MSQFNVCVNTSGHLPNSLNSCGKWRDIDIGGLPFKPGSVTRQVSQLCLAHAVTEGCGSSRMVRVRTERLSGAELAQSLLSLRSPSAFRCTAMPRVSSGFIHSTILESFKKLQEFLNTTAKDSSDSSEGAARGTISFQQATVTPRFP